MRETYGGMIEEALIEALESNLGSEQIKKALHEAMDKLVDEKIEGLKQKLIANVLDLLDGQDDIRDV